MQACIAGTKATRKEGNHEERLLRTLAGGALALAASLAVAQVPMTEGEVRKMDKHNQKISMLDKVKTGDKAQFRAVDEGGKITVTDIQPAK